MARATILYYQKLPSNQNDTWKNKSTLAKAILYCQKLPSNQNDTWKNKSTLAKAYSAGVGVVETARQQYFALCYAVRRKCKHISSNICWSCQYSGRIVWYNKLFEKKKKIQCKASGMKIRNMCYNYKKEWGSRLWEMEVQSPLVNLKASWEVKIQI